MCLPSSGRRLSGLSAVLLLSLFLVIRPAEPLPARDSVNITILETMTVPVIQNFSREYIRQIDRLGEETGTDYILTTLNAHGDREQALALLREQGSQAETDLIVSVATLASQAASEYIRGTGIPLLFTVVADPVGSGLVEEIGRPTHGQLTGIVAALPRTVQVDLALQLARQVVPDRPLHIGIITSDYPSSVGDIRMLREAATDQPIFFHDFTFPYRVMPEGLAGMLEDAAAGITALEGLIDFWWEVSGPLGEVPEFSALLQDHSGKPILNGNTRESVENGALFCMVQSIASTAEEAVSITRQILAGRSPGTIAVAPPDNFDLMVNLSTALELGIVIPPEMMELAGDTIFR